MIFKQKYQTTATVFQKQIMIPPVIAREPQYQGAILITAISPTTLILFIFYEQNIPNTILIFIKVNTQSDSQNYREVWFVQGKQRAIIKNIWKQTHAFCLNTLLHKCI